MTAVRALSFDLDGTLYRVRRARVAWRLRATRGLLVAMLGAREKLRREPPCPDRARLLDREAALVAPSFGWSVDEARQRLVDLHASLPYALARGGSPYPGVRAALTEAVDHGLKIAVLSDYEADQKLSELGIGDLPWSAVLGAESLGALKPDPRAFRTLAERLGVPASSIVHVGDREDLDVGGALGAGLRAWRFRPKGGGEPTRAEHAFTRWHRALFSPLFA